MLDVVSLFQVLPDKYLKPDSIPTVLRKAVTKKFPEFDVYQLAKYNKERAQKRKSKKQKEGKKPRATIATPATPAPKQMTLKQIIRKVNHYW
jgi:telomerase protein component 1